jgi:hypothetical protein
VPQMTDRWWWRVVGWAGAGFPADPSPAATRSCAPKKALAHRQSLFLLKNMLFQLILGKNLPLKDFGANSTPVFFFLKIKHAFPLYSLETFTF